MKKNMPYNPNIHHRRSIRIKGYDYSQEGLYFITICSQDRACLFGKIENNEMIFNDEGKMIDAEWLALTGRFKNIQLQEYMTMPNHFHGIVEIVWAPIVGALDNMGPPDHEDAKIIMYYPQRGNRKVLPRWVSKTWIPKTIQFDPAIIPKNTTVGDMMDAYKSISTVEYSRGVKNFGWQQFRGKLWQRNYF
ncbi:MAG: hypothetical protein ABI707_16900 [Ferruginibacter sp.]